MPHLARVVTYCGSLATLIVFVLSLTHDQFKTNTIITVSAIFLVIFTIALVFDISKFIKSISVKRQKIVERLDTCSIRLDSITSRLSGTTLIDKNWEKVVVSSPWQLLSVDYRLKYKNTSGSLVHFKKQQEIRPHRDHHLAQMEDTNIRTDGSINLDKIYSKPGTPVRDASEIEKHKVGTMISIITRFDPPKQRDVSFKREFGYPMLDSFCKEDETFGIHISHQVSRFTFTLIVPKPLVLSNPKVDVYLGAYKQESKFKPDLLPNNRHMNLIVEAPQLGEKYVVHWKVIGLK